MIRIDPIETAAGARCALRCAYLPPLRVGSAEPACGIRHRSRLPMLRRGLMVLAALALPVLGASLADPVHRVRQPQATQAVAALRAPLDGAAAALTDGKGARIVLTALEAHHPIGRP